MISAVVSGKKAVRRLRIASDCVEIDDHIEVPGRTDPRIDGLPVGLTERTGMVVLRSHIGRDGCSHDTKPVGMGAGDDLLIGGQHPGNEGFVLRRSDFAIARQATQVVNALKDDEPTHAGRGKHVAVEARKCVWTQAIGEEMISANSLV